MKVSFKKKIRKKYVTPRVRREVQEIFSQIEIYEHCIRYGYVEETHSSFVTSKIIGISNPTASHQKKLDEMQMLVKNFYKSLRNIRKKFNSEEEKIFEMAFLNHESDTDVMYKLVIQRDKYYELKGYIYFLLAIGFNIIDTENIEITDMVKVLC